MCTLGGGDFFQMGLENSLYKKKKYKSQTKNDFDCNFYNLSLLILHPNNFLVFCICILVFHGIHSPFHPQIYYFLWGLKVSSNLVARNWENFKFWGTFCIGQTQFPFWERRGRPFSFMKPSMTNHVSSRKVDGKIIFFMCIRCFSLLLRNFLFENFLSTHVSIQTLKKVFTIVW